MFLNISFLLCNNIVELQCYDYYVGLSRFHIIGLFSITLCLTSDKLDIVLHAPSLLSEIASNKRNKLM